MTTITNRYGELQTDWTSHKHPENPNFMQVVRYMHIQYKDGRSHLYWRLFNSSANDTHMIANISLSESQAKFVDEELTEADFQKYLTEKKANEKAN